MFPSQEFDIIMLHKFHNFLLSDDLSWELLYCGYRDQCSNLIFLNLQINIPSQGLKRALMRGEWED